MFHRKRLQCSGRPPFTQVARTQKGPHQWYSWSIYLLYIHIQWLLRSQRRLGLFVEKLDPWWHRELVRGDHYGFRWVKVGGSRSQEEELCILVGNFGRGSTLATRYRAWLWWRRCNNWDVGGRTPPQITCNPATSLSIDWEGGAQNKKRHFLQSCFAQKFEQKLQTHLDMYIWFECTPWERISYIGRCFRFYLQTPDRIPLWKLWCWCCCCCW